MARARAGLLSVWMWIWPACASEPKGELLLNVPRAPSAHEATTIVVEVGVLPRGQEIVVSTVSGKLIGIISPFGIGPGKRAGSYALPVPDEVVLEGKLRVKFTVIGGAGGERAPSAAEIRTVSVSMTPR